MHRWWILLVLAAIACERDTLRIQIYGHLELFCSEPDHPVPSRIFFRSIDCLWEYEWKYKEQSTKHPDMCVLSASHSLRTFSSILLLSSISDPDEKKWRTRADFSIGEHFSIFRSCRVSNDLVCVGDCFRLFGPGAVGVQLFAWFVPSWFNGVRGEGLGLVVRLFCELRRDLGWVVILD